MVLRQLSVDEDHLYGDQLLEIRQRYVELPGDPERVATILVIEFGTRYGGSAVYFANIMRQIGQPFKVLTVDNSHKALDPRARREPDVLFVESSSTDPAIAEQIQRLKNEYPGKIFAILDSDHSMNHVLAEMKLLRPLLSAGDYLVVEDSNINGHPVLPGFGPGPMKRSRHMRMNFQTITSMMRSGRTNSAGLPRPTDF